MSVKTMTTKQIQDDLKVIALTWPDAVPWEQADRVNALKTELKRRGEDPVVKPDRVTIANRGAIDMLPTEELEKELRGLSDQISRDPSNEEAQQRFADVRFEIRRRAKAQPNGDDAALQRPSLPPRELELPPDDEVPRKPATVSPEILDEIRSQQLVPRRPTAGGKTELGAPAQEEPTGGLVDRVGKLLLERALLCLNNNSFIDAVGLIGAFVQLRSSVRDKPSSL